MSMSAEAEHEQRTAAEEHHGELLLALLLLQSRDIASQIARGLPYVIDNAPIRQALLDAGYAGAQIIADNAVTPKEIVDVLKTSGYIEEAADVASNQMRDTTAKRIEAAIEAIREPDVTPTDREKAKAVKAELDNIAPSRAPNAAGNMVVDGAEGLKDRLVNQGTKTWVNMGDKRVRLTHRAAGGQTVQADGFFIVGGAMLRHPRDPAAPLKETARCRCVARYSREW